MEKTLIILLVILSNLGVYSQSEGQGFCDEYDNPSYFPLDIEKKRIVWGKTYYFEEAIKWQDIDSLEYLAFTQTWENGDIDTIYLREENGAVYQYREICTKDMIRFNPSFNIGDSYNVCDNEEQTFTIISDKGKLKTPYCSYKNLYVVKSESPRGTVKFYYQKGYGYVGGTNEDGALISYVTPWQN